MNWLFDLDDTLYSASTEFFSLVSKRITDHICQQLNLSWDAARTLQRQYWQQYGTSLRGLVLHHQAEPEAFFAAVHRDVPVESYLQPDPAVRAMLLRCVGRRYVFTNSPAEYAARILRVLQLDDLFETIFDIRAMSLVPKPDPQAYRLVLAAIGCEGSSCLMVDDNPLNLATARQFGIRTVWLNSSLSEAGRAVADGHLAGPQPDLVITRLLDLEAALARTSWLGAG